LRSGLFGRLSQGSTDLRRVEAEASLGAVAEPHRAEIVGMVVNEIAADPEPPRDLGRVNQFDVGLIRPQQSGYPSRHRLYVRIAEDHRLFLLSAESAHCSG
jgi:hypothetical protein